MKNLTHILSISIVLISAVLAHAQTDIRIHQSTGYQSNVFYNNYQLPDMTNQFGISLSHTTNHNNTESQFYYDGDVNLFRTYTARQYFYHQLGYDGAVSTTSDIYFGAGASWIDGKDTYALYDYRAFNIYLSGKKYLRSNVIGRLGVRLDRRAYTELYEFNYWQNTLFSQLNTYFQTGTSMTLVLSYQWKLYSPYEINGYLYDAMLSVDQAVLRIGLAQSLGMQTAIKFRYQLRQRVGLFAGDPTAIADTYLITEDELFDDPFGYNSNEVAMSLTNALLFNFKLQTTTGYLGRDYHNRRVYDPAGMTYDDSARHSDNRIFAWTTLSRNFGWGKQHKSIQVWLTVGYLNNNSNDGYYDYENMFARMGFDVKIY